MDMSMGMSMGDPLMRTYNQKLAHDFWFIVGGLIGSILILRGFELYETRSRLRLSRNRLVDHPTRPRSRLSQFYATATAICREMAYPHLYIRWPFSWLSPPPLGGILLLLSYWAMVIYMMSNDAIISDYNYYERIGFRAAWISLTQVPLIYLLSSKASILAVLIGSSYERLNWLHRWTSRTLLVTVTVHGGFFVREYVLADFLSIELQLMPMVKWGMGAWAILVWTFLTSLYPLRQLSYEFFVLQHIVSAGVFLWVVCVHVPSYSHYFVWVSIGAVCFDWVIRGLLLCYKNFHLRRSASWLGHDMQLHSNGNDITSIAVHDVRLKWKAGQHLRIWIPRLGPLETHPFTIASQPRSPDDDSPRALDFVVHARSGISRRMYKYSQKLQHEDKIPILKVLISGPYGTPPNWNTYETLILIAASTGASFTLPILETALESSTTNCVQHIRFLLLTREQRFVDYYTQRLSQALVRASEKGFDLSVEVAVTGATGDIVVSDVISVRSTDCEEAPQSRTEKPPTGKTRTGGYFQIRQCRPPTNAVKLDLLARKKLALI